MIEPAGYWGCAIPDRAVNAGALTPGPVAHITYHDFSNCRAAADNHAGGEGNHGRELFCLELSPVLVLETGARRRGGGCVGPATGARHSAGRLFAHPVLPETLPLLLLSGLHGQRLHRHQGLSGTGDSRAGALRQAAVHWGPQAAVYLLRRGDALLPVRVAASAPGGSDEVH